ncbi:hypothetical protein KEH51_26080 [[Brevibacterium] frigoritolerans]|uniref:Uncharacterized protein n=1 Tax=Peribacillus frigoritolerans TaxID=450367 RepID=A0A941J3M3_9BACI|nr:hypothetical protein [Peribacillus frigoritolerans]
MIRIIIIGFLMLGLLSLLRLTIQERINFPMASINKWILMLTGMILVSVLVGFAAPKLSRSGRTRCLILLPILIKL